MNRARDERETLNDRKIVQAFADPALTTKQIKICASRLKGENFNQIDLSIM